MRAKFEIYPEKSAPLDPVKWRWRLKGGNGEIMAQGESHTTEKLARTAVRRIKRTALFASVVNV